MAALMQGFFLREVHHRDVSTIVEILIYVWLIIERSLKNENIELNKFVG
jgi:hypothetical protein